MGRSLFGRQSLFKFGMGSAIRCFGIDWISWSESFFVCFHTDLKNAYAVTCLAALPIR